MVDSGGIKGTDPTAFQPQYSFLLLQDAHILYEIFWQAVAVLADITCKISKEA